MEIPYNYEHDYNRDSPKVLVVEKTLNKIEYESISIISRIRASRLKPSYLFLIGGLQNNIDICNIQGTCI